MDFVAIDFETAVGYVPCSVGIIKVENSRIVEEFSTLIRPPRNFYDWRTIRVHGIKPEQTRHSKSFAQIYPEIKRLLQGQTVIAHNESFDRNVLRKSMDSCGLEYSDLSLSDKWVCTVQASKKSKRYPRTKLSVCCEQEGIPLDHHDALSDARGCALLYLRLHGQY